MTKFFTNQKNNTLLDRLQNILKYHQNIEFLEFLIGYFRISGFKNIAPLLENKVTRILVGIDIDKLTFQAKELGVKQDLFFIDSALEEFKNSSIKDINSSDYIPNIQESVFLLAKLIKENKLQIKIYPSKNLHSKIYILREELKYNETIEQRGSVITGSSNLTENGLSKNYEFNVELNSNDDISFALNEFERLWNTSVDLKFEDIQTIKNNTYLKDITPCELYIKFLIENFDDIIDIDDTSFIPKNIYKLSYQIDAVNDGIKKLQKHNGFFLSDVVGLGKTITTSMIAKKLLLMGLKGQILVITPPAIKKEWEETFEKFKIGDFKHYDIISIGKIKNIDSTKYELIIIDESHKFKNFNTSRYKELETITKEKSTYHKKVILISATPLNNRPSDLANQIYLFQDKRNSTITSVINLEEFFGKIKKEYDEVLQIAKKTQKIDKVKLEKIATKIKDFILKELMVRRTRTDIISNEMYKKDLDAQNLKIPKVNSANEIKYQLNDELATKFSDTIEILTMKLKYERYKILSYLTLEARKKFGKGISQNIFDTGALELAVLMQMQLIKRFESSFYAFKISINRQYKHLKHLIEMFENDKIIIGLPNIYDLDDEKIDDFLISGKLKEFNKSDFSNNYLEKLKKDFEYIKELKNMWENVEDDPKIDKLKEILKNNTQKIVIFTESSDTAEYISNHLDKVLLVTGENRDKLKETIRENFDENYKTKENEFNIIVTTDTLAEGINLHRSNTIYNYDIPWNATKLMQRIGRINRIGTTFDEIFVYNFIPTSNSEKYIDLTKRAFIKLQTFHSALGEDDKVFIQEEDVQTFSLFEDNQKDEEIEFLSKLRDFKKFYPKKYQEIKKLPNKIRVQRKGTKQTLVFLKTKKQKSYFKVDKNITPISFIECAKILEADKTEKGINLEKFHYDDVKRVIEYYQKELNKNVVETIKISHKFDKQALKKLKALFTQKYLDKENYEILKDNIENGVLQNLAKEINKTEPKNVYNLISKYNLTKTKKNYISLNVDIVLSESFS